MSDQPRSPGRRRSSSRSDTDTLDDVGDARTARRAAVSRRGVLAVMLAVVGAGGSGWLGLRTQRRTATASGYTVTLDFPRVARAGMDVTWRVRLSRDVPFDPAASLVLAVTASYFDVFETQGFVPEPAQDTRDGRWRYLELAPVDGADVVLLDFDTYVQPAAQIGRDGRLRLVVDDADVTSLSWSTTLLP